MIYIGIDPGAKGFLTAIKESGIEYLSIADNTMNDIADYLNGLQFEDKCLVCMEEVHAIFGSSAKATFAFGQIFGQLLGFLVAYKIPYVLVPPKTWQSRIWGNCDKVFAEGKKVDTKGTSINAAMRLYPKEDLRRTTACKKADDNKADSLLIATYAKVSGL